MKPFTALALAIGSVMALPVHAHISYSGRDLGTFDASGTSTISNQNVSGNFGWADASDMDLGDSHKARYFKFTLNTPAEVTVTATGNASATASTFAPLSPGFSLYAGLAVPAAYDTADISLLNRPASSEGSWNSLGTFSIGNDAGDLGTLTFVGHAVDGPTLPLGWTASGPIMGDGMVDGTVSKSFDLSVGTYTIAVGGMDYAAQDPSNPNFSRPYGVTMALSVAAVPEPETYALMAAGLALIGVATRRRRALRVA